MERQERAFRDRQRERVDNLISIPINQGVNIRSHRVIPWVSSSPAIKSESQRSFVHLKACKPCSPTDLESIRYSKSNDHNQRDGDEVVIESELFRIDCPTVESATMVNRSG